MTEKTEFQVMKEAFLRVLGAEDVQVYEWADGTSALGLNFGGDGGYLEFNNKGELDYCTHNC